MHKKRPAFFTWTLLWLWVFLISFGAVSASNPEWLRELSKKGVEVESRSNKDFGDIYMYRHDFNSAIARYKRALSIKPDLVDAIVNLAVAYNYTGQYEAAEKLLKNALTLVRSQTGTIYYNLGLLYEKLGKHEEAIDVYRRALDSEMDQWIIYRSLARMFKALGRMEETVEALEKALQIQTDPALGYRNMLYHSLCVYENEEKHLKAIRELLPVENWNEALSRFDLKIILAANRVIGTSHRRTGNSQMDTGYRENLIWLFFTIRRP